MIYIHWLIFIVYFAFLSLIFYIAGNTNILDKPKSFCINIKNSVEEAVNKKFNNKLTKKGVNLLSWIINYIIMLTIIVLPILFIAINIVSVVLDFSEGILSIFIILSIYFYILPGILFLFFPWLIYLGLSRIILMVGNIIFGLEKTSLVDLYPIGIRRIIMVEDFINSISLFVVVIIGLIYLIPIIKEDLLKN